MIHWECKASKVMGMADNVVKIIDCDAAKIFPPNEIKDRYRIYGGRRKRSARTVELHHKFAGDDG